MPFICLIPHLYEMYKLPMIQKLPNCVKTSNYKVFHAAVQEAPFTQICACDGLSRDTEVEIKVLQVVYFTVPGWQKVKQWAFGIFFHNCSYGHQYRSQIGLHF